MYVFTMDTPRGPKRVGAISDMHGRLPDPDPLVGVDLLLIAGDVTSGGHEKAGGLAGDAAWLSGVFSHWLRYIKAKKVIAVAGNHDWLFERMPGLVPEDVPWTYLQDSGCEAYGMTFWGCPWQLPFNEWAFNAEEEDIEAQLSLAPARVDVLLTHGPALDVLDYPFPGGRRCGSDAIGRFCRERQVRLMVHGHIHGGRGIYTPDGWAPATVNAACRDETYKFWADNGAEVFPFDPDARARMVKTGFDKFDEAAGPLSPGAVAVVQPAQSWPAAGSSDPLLAGLAEAGARELGGAGELTVLPPGSVAFCKQPILPHRSNKEYDAGTALYDVAEKAAACGSVVFVPVSGLSEEALDTYAVARVAPLGQGRYQVNTPHGGETILHLGRRKA